MNAAANLLGAIGFGADTGGLIIWCKEVDGPGRPAKRFDDIAAAVSWAQERVPSFDVYFGQTPQLPLERDSRGTEARAMALLSLWCDLDCAGATHANGNLPTRQEAEAFIKDLVLPPSALVWSGGGFQLYWFLKEPIVIGSEDDRRKARALVEGWQEYVRQRLGRDLDHTSDLARVLRLPGTINHKNGSSAPVELLELYRERRYHPGDFEDYIQTITPGAKSRGVKDNGRDSQSESGRDGVNPADVLRGVPEGHRDEMLFRYACSLRARGRFSRVEAEALVLLAASRCTPPFDPRAAAAKVERAWKHTENEANAAFGQEGSPGEPRPKPASATETATEPKATSTEGERRKEKSGSTSAEDNPTDKAETEAAGVAERIPRGFRRPAEVLEAIPSPKFRFRTDIPSLNNAGREGLPTGIVIVIVGWPDAGKTGLMTQIILSIAMNYEVVAVLFTPDGGQEATAIRIGGLLGFDQDRLEARDPEEKAKLAERLHERRIFIVNDSEDGMVFERIREEAERIRPDLPHIYGLDSAQECLATETADELDERHRAIELMRAVYRTVEANPIPSLTVVTSQAAGQAFTPAKKSDRTPPIGAPAESKKISYLCHMVVALEGDPSRGPDFGRAAVVKSKLRGPKPSFVLQVDPLTSRLKEIDSAVVEEAAENRKARAREKRVAKIADWIENLLIKSGPLLVEEIRSRISGDKSDIAAALDGLEAQGRAAWEPAGKTNRGRRWRTSKGPKAPET